MTTSPPIRVLVVDDDETVRLNLVAYFEDEGLEVLPAHDAEQALALLPGDQPVNVGIIDIRLPGMDGDELILKAHELQPGMKFLIHTGSSNYMLHKPLLDIGITMAQVFVKPVSDMGVLLEAILCLIKEQKGK